MPRLDRTGPSGFGPGTGWGLGPCGAGMGWRRGWGQGFGRFWRFGSSVAKEEEREILQEEIKVLEDDIKAIKERLTELKTKK